MYITKVTDDFDSFINFIKNENEYICIKVKYLLLSIPSSILLLSLTVYLNAQFSNLYQLISDNSEVPISFTPRKNCFFLTQL